MKYKLKTLDVMHKINKKEDTERWGTEGTLTRGFETPK
jgi:hypothetical protein